MFSEKIYKHAGRIVKKKKKKKEGSVRSDALLFSFGKYVLAYFITEPVGYPVHFLVSASMD